MAFDLEVVELSDEDGTEYDARTLEKNLPSAPQADRALEAERNRLEAEANGTYTVTPISGKTFEQIDLQGSAYRRYRIKPAKGGAATGGTGG